MSERKGPIESRAWPEAIEAFVVDSSAERVCGYAVAEDLAVHYRFTDVILLTLTGELPSEQRGRAFEVALTCALPVSVAESPIHAAVIAGYCGARPGLLLSAASVALGEGAVSSLEAVTPFLDGHTELPPRLRATTDADRRFLPHLVARLQGTVDVPLLGREPRRDLALVAVLHACGLTTPLQVATALSLARLPVAAAEAAPRNPDQFVEKYPMDTPPFRYEEP